MKHDTEITAEQILRGRPAPTCPDAGSRTISATEVVAAFRRRFEIPPDVGIWKRPIHSTRNRAAACARKRSSWGRSHSRLSL